MKVLSRFQLDANDYGYLLDYDGVDYPVTEHGLYEQDILEGLIKEGYKILDYHGNIMTPENINIKDMIVTPCTATEDERQMMYDIAEEVLTEAEATKYFSREIEINAVEFKEPKISIETREELLNYLDRCKNMSRYASIVQDVRPLNSFVAKEALFTMEELACDVEVKEYFRIIAGRRKLQSFKAYRDLIQFLQNEGVLGETFTANDVKTAYLAWGICGIKTSVTNMYIEVGATTDICAESATAEKYDKDSQRAGELCLMNKQGIIHYLDGEIDLSDCDDFDTEVLRPTNEESYYTALHSANSWEADYFPIKCLVKKYRNRTYFDLLDENGVKYMARVDINKFVIKDSRSTIYYDDFLYVKCIDGYDMPLDKVSSERDYRKQNLLRAKARDLIRNKTIKPPVNDSFSLLLREGVSPEAAIRYIGRRIKDAPTLNVEHQNGINYDTAYETYRVGPPKFVVRKYNPNNYTYNNFDELIEIMCATRDEMEERGEYLVVSKDSIGVEAINTREELNMRYIENLEFVKLAKEGGITIDHLFQGKKMDGCGDNIETIAELIELIIKIKYKSKELSTAELTEEIGYIEDTTLINFDKVIRERSAAYKGYLKDRALLNEHRAKEASYLTYIQRVFREMANTPAQQQRHYIFECYAINTMEKTKGERILYSTAGKIAEAFDNITEIPVDIRNIIKLEATALAAKLMFGIFLNKVNVIGSDGNNTIVALDYNLDNIQTVLQVHIPTDYINDLKNGRVVSKRFCTLKDWCDYEMRSGNLFTLYCLNANITPWEVIPKNKIEIYDYNFAINFMTKEGLAKNCSGELIEKIVSEYAYVFNNMRDRYSTNSLLESNLFLMTDNEKREGEDMGVLGYTEDTIDTVLAEEIDETAVHYYNRFILHCITANKNKKYLKMIPLKSDIAYVNYADLFNVEIVEENIYQDIETSADSKNARLYLTEVTPNILSDKENKENMLECGNRIRVFDIEKCKYQDLARWTELVNGTFKSQAICSYSAGRLSIARNAKRIVVDLKELSMDDALKLVGKGIFYQLNASEFMVNAMGQSITVEVRV